MKQEQTISNHKNLTYQDRLNIEERLKAGYTFKAIVLSNKLQALSATS